MDRRAKVKEVKHYEQNLYGYTYLIQSLKEALSEMIQKSYIKKEIATTIIENACSMITHHLLEQSSNLPDISATGKLEFYRYHRNQWQFIITNSTLKMADGQYKEIENGGKSFEMDGYINANSTVLSDNSIDLTATSEKPKEIPLKNSFNKATGAFYYKSNLPIKIISVDSKLWNIRKRAYTHPKTVETKKLRS